jgi:hypothetical protein
MVPTFSIYPEYYSTRGEGCRSGTHVAINAASSMIMLEFIFILLIINLQYPKNKQFLSKNTLNAAC